MANDGNSPSDGDAQPPPNDSANNKNDSVTNEVEIVRVSNEKDASGSAKGAKSQHTPTDTCKAGTTNTERKSTNVSSSSKSTTRKGSAQVLSAEEIKRKEEKMAEARARRLLKSTIGQGEPIYEPRALDVLCGRGMGYRFAHPGNRRFRELCAERLEEYAFASKRSIKTKIVKDIVREVHEAGGRFLVFGSPPRSNNTNKEQSSSTTTTEKNGNDKDTTATQKNNKKKKRGLEMAAGVEDDRPCWYQGTYQVAREKVGHTLRDAASCKNKSVANLHHQQKLRRQMEQQQQKLFGHLEQQQQQQQHQQQQQQQQQQKQQHQQQQHAHHAAAQVLLNPYIPGAPPVLTFVPPPAGMLRPASLAHPDAAVMAAAMDARRSVPPGPQPAPSPFQPPPPQQQQQQQHPRHRLMLQQQQQQQHPSSNNGVGPYTQAQIKPVASVQAAALVENDRKRKSNPRGGGGGEVIAIGDHLDGNNENSKRQQQRPSSSKEQKAEMLGDSELPKSQYSPVSSASKKKKRKSATLSSSSSSSSSYEGIPPETLAQLSYEKHILLRDHHHHQAPPPPPPPLILGPGGTPVALGPNGPAAAAGPMVMDPYQAAYFASNDNKKNAAAALLYNLKQIQRRQKQFEETKKDLEMRTQNQRRQFQQEKRALVLALQRERENLVKQLHAAQQQQLFWQCKQDALKQQLQLLTAAAENPQTFGEPTENKAKTSMAMDVVGDSPDASLATSSSSSKAAATDRLTLGHKHAGASSSSSWLARPSEDDANRATRRIRQAVLPPDQVSSSSSQPAAASAAASDGWSSAFLPPTQQEEEEEEEEAYRPNHTINSTRGGLGGFSRKRCKHSRQHDAEDRPPSCDESEDEPTPRPPNVGETTDEEEDEDEEASARESEAPSPSPPGHQRSSSPLQPCKQPLHPVVEDDKETDPNTTQQQQHKSSISPMTAFEDHRMSALRKLRNKNNQGGPQQLHCEGDNADAASGEKQQQGDADEPMSSSSSSSFPELALPTGCSRRVVPAARPTTDHEVHVGQFDDA